LFDYYEQKDGDIIQMFEDNQEISLARDLLRYKEFYIKSFSLNLLDKN
jgi:hypothetical protein